jgi:uncharacterized protein YjhX (UPF0386 family)
LRAYRSEKYLWVLATLAGAGRAMRAAEFAGTTSRDSSPHSRRNATWQLFQRLARRGWVEKGEGGTYSITAAGRAVLADYRAAIARQKQVIAITPRMPQLREARQELRETVAPQTKQSRQGRVKTAITCDLCGEEYTRDDARQQLRRHGAVICLRCNRDLTVRTEEVLNGEN